MDRLEGEELATLSQRARSGDIEARNRIVEANVGLAKSVANSMMRAARWRRRHGVMGEADIIQEAIVGLTRAAGDFDPSSGNAFSTYAVYWIRHQVNDAMRSSHPVAVPDRAHWDAIKIRRMSPTAIDALRLGTEGVPAWSADRLDCAMKALAAFGAASLEIDPDGRGAESDPLDAMVRQEDTCRLRAAMGRLKPIQRQALELRYGIGCDPVGDREIGERLGCSNRMAYYRVSDGRKRLAAMLA